MQITDEERQARLEAEKANVQVLLHEVCPAILHSTEFSNAQIVGYMAAVANIHPRSELAYVPLKRLLSLFTEAVTRERPHG